MAVAAMSDPRSRSSIAGRWGVGLVRLASVLEWALWLRVLAAVVVQWVAGRKGALCIFPDTRIYWLLAGAIAEGRTYEVLQWGDHPHFALRTPGYPLFLAACRLAFGARTMPVRLVQALLGAASVWLVFRLTARVAPARRVGRLGSVPLVAAAVAAFDPFLAGTAALLLSEAVFIPLMLGSLWCLAEAWDGPDDEGTARSDRWRGGLWAFGSGVASGAAVLVRPSWLLFVPTMLLAWLTRGGRWRRGRAWRGGVLVVLGTVAVLSPWWIRNARVYGRFVPTAIWTGASLYDGLNPRATGASDMDEFLADPEIASLGEEAQDAELSRRAVAFARAHPRRVVELAAWKAARYWSPWPNADGLKTPFIVLASMAINVPIMAAMALGAWDRRRDLRALALLAGPILYFCALHMVFASSMRYRIPAAVPALGLAAIGFGRAWDRSRGDPGPDSSPDS
jgi:4-amino-4-deoxy-L-arabinose transferase-like glycosyltransferase